MKYFLVAGEASGDLHASNLICELKNYDSAAHFRFWGGDLMQNVSGEAPLKHYKELAFMGFVDVVLNLRAILKNFKLIKQQILDYQPDVVILVDYPGFNLRLVKFLKQHHIKVFYYISPTIWAWKSSRVKQIKAYVDEMYAILPFEKEVYERYDYSAQYMGHPLLDAIANFKRNKALTKAMFLEKYALTEKPIVALLPGSRKREISTKLPLMLESVEHFSDFQFVVSVAPSVDVDWVANLCSGHQVTLVENDTYNLLMNSYAALVTSGTATLETALFNVPQVVCYKMGGLTYHIIKRLVNIRFISLVNLILDEEVVKELIQNDLNPKNINLELNKILNTPFRDQQLKDYDRFNAVLEGEGASQRIAEDMFNKIS